jgi:putative DNA primase/helicase
MDIDYTCIPDALTARPQWVVWRAEERNGKLTKVPYNARTGQLAESDNPDTWSTYADAVGAVGNYSGIGYVFSPHDPYTGIDLDDCIVNGQVLPWAEKILLALSSYSEISPSGTGIKVWVEGKTPGSAKPRKAKIPPDIIPADVSGSIEIYPAERFFTVTGWHVDGMPHDICNANGALTTLYEALRPPPIDLPRATTRPAGRKYLERWAQHKIDYAVEQVRGAIDGERHNTRYAMARLLGGLVPHGLATDDQIARALFDAQQPKTQAQRSEYKTILDGIRDGARAPLPLPPEPEQPVFDEAGYALCPKHQRALDAAHSGNGWVCRARDGSTERGWCTFWWDGDDYSMPRAVDPETGEVLYAESADFLLNAHRSDTGNAECLAQISGDDLRYCHTRKKWLAWDGSRWAIDEGSATAHRAMIVVVRARYRACEAIPDLDQRKKASSWCVGCESTNKLEAALRTATRLMTFSTTIERWDGNQLIAAALGATLDLRSVVHRAVRREDYLTMQFGAIYDPEATCPRWLQFLDEVFLSNAELIAYIQRAIGYCLTGDTREQKLFLCHGTGANGKSVFLEILVALLGDYAANASFETFDANRRSESSNDLAMLRGKRLVTVIETEEGKRLAEARVKSVTGQDLITCRFLYGEYFSYRPTYKIWLAMNHLPIIKGTDKGIWRRVELIPFKADFEGHEDKTLATALREELDGIFQWALEGLRQWWQRGLDTPEIVKRATKQYREDSDQVGRWIADRCIVVSNVFLSSGTGYKNYEAWCKEVGEDAVSQNKWSRRMNEKGFQGNPDTSKRGWIGIGLRVAPENEDS